MKELEANGPAVAVAPRWLLIGRDCVVDTRSAKDDATACDELRKHAVLRIEPKVVVPVHSVTFFHCGKDLSRTSRT